MACVLVHFDPLHRTYLQPEAVNWLTSLSPKITPALKLFHFSIPHVLLHEEQLGHKRPRPVVEILLSPFSPSLLLDAQLEGFRSFRVHDVLSETEKRRFPACRRPSQRF